MSKCLRCGAGSEWIQGRVVDEPKATAQLIQMAFRDGVKAAAEIADDYNASSSHPYRLGDCIAMKLNATTRKRARRNEKRSELGADGSPAK